MTITQEQIWGAVGLLGQGAFTARFLVQWLASERKRETVMPVAFWWFSLTGGLITLTYVIHLGSLSLTIGQSMGLLVYVRNLMLVSKARRRAAKRAARRFAVASGGCSGIEASNTVCRTIPDKRNLRVNLAQGDLAADRGEPQDVFRAV